MELVEGAAAQAGALTNSDVIYYALVEIRHRQMEFPSADVALRIRVIGRACQDTWPRFMALQWVRIRR